MIEIGIDPRIREAAPGMVLGCVEAAVVTEPGSEALWAEMNEAGALTSARAGEPAAEPPIAALRALYRVLGKEPSRYRGSPEALLRRVRAGKELYRIHNVVDVVNLVSLATLLPIGLYDRERLAPPVVFRRGEPGETYDGIGKESLNLDGLPVLADAEGLRQPHERLAADDDHAGRAPDRRRDLRRHRPRRPGAGGGDHGRAAAPPRVRHGSGDGVRGVTGQEVWGRPERPARAANEKRRPT